MKLDPLPHSIQITKLTLKWITGLYVRAKAIKPLEYRSQSLWFWIKQSLLRYDSEVQARKEKIDKSDFIKIQNCYTSLKEAKELYTEN